MGYPKRDHKTGGDRGGKRFGGPPPWKRGFDRPDMGRPMLHSAICADCGDRCEVPFKPNGRKPVLCVRCFKKDEGGGFDDRRSSPRREPPRDTRETRDNSSIQLQEQLRTINAKLDTILEALSDE